MTVKCFACDSLVEPIGGVCPKCQSKIFYRQRSGGAKKSQVKAFMSKMRKARRLLDERPSAVIRG